MQGRGDCSSQPSPRLLACHCFSPRQLAIPPVRPAASDQATPCFHPSPSALRINSPRSQGCQGLAQPPPGTSASTAPTSHHAFLTTLVPPGLFAFLRTLQGHSCPGASAPVVASAQSAAHTACFLSSFPFHLLLPDLPESLSPPHLCHSLPRSLCDVLRETSHHLETVSGLSTLFLACFCSLLYSQIPKTVPGRYWVPSKDFDKWLTLRSWT